MTDSGTNSKKLSFEKNKSEAMFFGIASAVLLGIFFFVPVIIIQGFALLGLAVSSWHLLFHGSTAISISLVGVARQRFQIAVAVVVPLLMSIYFVKDATSINLQNVFGNMFDLWFLIPLGIITYFSWAFADQLNVEHPFRGFLIASTILFVICFIGHNGYHSVYDDYSESSSFVLDKESAQRASETGRYFGQFLVYVMFSYAAMVAKLLRRKESSTNSTMTFQEAADIAGSYGDVLQNITPGTVADTSKLPFPKPIIKQAIISLLKKNKDPQMLEHLKISYFMLADWQDGVGDKNVGLDPKNMDVSDPIELANQIASQSEEIKKWSAIAATERQQLQDELRKLGY